MNNRMTDQDVKYLKEKLDTILSELNEIKKWRFTVDRAFEGDNVHGHLSYDQRIRQNRESIKDTRKEILGEVDKVSRVAEAAHSRLDKILYITAGIAAGSGIIGSQVFKLILGI